MAELNLLDARGLSKSFGAVKAVDGLDLLVAPGEIVGLVGPDGAGKTTALRLVCGALRLDAGEVSIVGIDLRREADRAREHIGYLSQRFSMYEDLSVLENIRFFAEVRGLKQDEWEPRAREILDFVGLGPFADRRAGQLSGGMKQKLGLAGALVHHPKLLLLDEPTGGVDPVTRQDFWQLLIRRVATEGVGVLVSTPYMDEAARCSRVILMQKGKQVAAGTPASLRERLAGRILEVRGTPLAELRHRSAKLPGVEDVQTFGDRLHLRLAAATGEGAQQAQSGLAAGGGVNIELVRLIPPQLEDVFIAFAAGEGKDG
ncbi:MAG: ABC transporter ATP-binding protein [Anaerolineae bacterium]|nr:MAG: ABC transporter ATP-binding protein [Anaerolineae bacterium]